MAESDVKESKQQPALGPGDELHSQVESLCEAIDREVDSNMPGRDDLAEVSKVLRVINGKITPTATGGDADKDKEQQLLPMSKREELSNLLPTIRRPLEQRKQQALPKQDEDRPAAAAAADKDDTKQKEEGEQVDGSIFDQLLKEEADET
ncbi:unnamed protein product [Urochloa humidicola]